MLGVEPAERDRDGKPHQIQVKVGRQNVEVRARRQVQYTRLTPNSWSRDVVMGRVLRSPAANTELPMRLSTYTFRDAAPNKVKLILAAEIDPESMEKELDLAIGFAIFDDLGKVVLSGPGAEGLLGKYGSADRYELALPVDPGPVPIAAGRRRYVGEERQRRAGSACVRDVEPGICDRGPHPQLGARG
jgi:hypothetical protein